MYIADYHIHSTNSGDSSGTVDAICRRAVREKISEIAITDHFDPWAGDRMCEKTYSRRKIEKEIAEARRRFGTRLKIRMGIEVGQAHLYPDSAKKVLEGRYDFVLGSVHNIGADEDLAAVKYTRENARDYFDAYFEALLETARLGYYDCLSHLDYPKKYAAMKGIGMEFSRYAEIIEEILKTVISYGKGIEVNCSGLRSTVGATLPGIRILRMYKNLGGEIITVGSDAHNEYLVGLNLRKGYRLIRECGFSYITCFEDRKPKFVKY